MLSSVEGFRCQLKTDINPKDRLPRVTRPPPSDDVARQLRFSLFPSRYRGHGLSSALLSSRSSRVSSQAPDILQKSPVFCFRVLPVFPKLPPHLPDSTGLTGLSVAVRRRTPAQVPRGAPGFSSLGGAIFSVGSLGESGPLLGEETRRKGVSS